MYVKIANGERSSRSEAKERFELKTEQKFMRMNPKLNKKIDRQLKLIVRKIE